MLFIESTKESNRNANFMHPNALTVCYQSVAGKQREGEIAITVISSRMPALVFNEREWESFLRELDVSDSLSNSLERAIVFHLVDVPEVVEVYFAQQGDTIDVWTILSVNDKKTRHKVYEKEIQIIKGIPWYVINFRISGKEGAGAPASALYRKVDVEVVRRSKCRR